MVKSLELEYNEDEYRAVHKVANYFKIGIGDIIEFDLEKFTIVDAILNTSKNYRQSIFREKLEYIMKHFNIDKFGLAKASNHSHIGIESLLKKREDRDDDTPPLIMIEGLANNLKINPNWLMYNEDEMLKEGAKVNSNHNIISKSKDVKKNIQSQGGVNQTENHSPVSSNELEMLRQENAFLKKQLEYTQSLLEKSMSK